MILPSTGHENASLQARKRTGLLIGIDNQKGIAVTLVIGGNY